MLGTHRGLDVLTWFHVMLAMSSVIARWKRSAIAT
jgi:hypothetical protein